MLKWLAQNKEWLFSGAGLTVLGVFLWLAKKFLSSRRQNLAAPANAVTQAHIITVSPTFNLSSQESSSPEPTKLPIIPPAAPTARPNLKIEATKVGKIYLQGDIWTLAPGERSRETPFRGLFVDVANVPTGSGNIKAVKVKAALTIQSRSYSPLPWLEEYTNAVRLEPAGRKTIVLAVGHDRPMGSWHFVLNHRDNRNSLNEPSRMDWTNLAPIPSDLPLEILLVDVDSGELAAKFEYLWTFDANLNWPILKTHNSEGRETAQKEKDDAILPNIGCLRPELTTVTYNEASDVWSKGNGEGFPAAVVPFSNEPRPPKKTAAVDGLRARLTYYKRDGIEEFKRVDSGCWLGEAYRYADLEVGGIVYVIAALQLDRHGGVVANPRYSAARYSEDHSVVDPLPDGNYELKVDLTAGDHGEYAETYWFQLEVGEQLKIQRLNQRPAGMS